MTELGTTGGRVQYEPDRATGWVRSDEHRCVARTVDGRRCWAPKAESKHSEYCGKHRAVFEVALRRVESIEAALAEPAEPEGETP